MFGAICRTCQNRPCSKPWAIAQAFCSKSANFRPLQIHPKSTKTGVQGGKNKFRRVLEPFQSVWSDLQNLSKSAMFKTMGYSPGFLLKIGQFSSLANSPISTETVVQVVKNQFGRVLEPFQSVSSDLQNLSKSSMSANFRALRIHSKSTETVVQVVKNQFRRVLEPFQ